MVAKQADGVCPQCGGILTALSKGGIFFWSIVNLHHCRAHQQWHVF
jgi:ssDNA-binding Zn-finger/Zn-ribbon topoisomerase 1